MTTSRYEDVSRKLLRLHSSPWRWAGAAVAFGVALVVRLVLHENLPPGYPFLTFFPAVILTAFIGGLWPGLAVAIASLIASWYFFIPPFYSLELNGASTLALGFFASISAVDLTVIHIMFEWLQRLDVEREKSRQLAISRDLMFNEMHHRVSNDLMLVATLIRMQRRSVSDPEAIRALDEASNRLALVGKIHRQLHDPAGQQLPFGLFLKGRCDDLIEASGAKNVACLMRADEVFLPSERAIPVGLIVAELFANCLEHGFAGQANGTVKVDLAKDGDGAIITVEDDGLGLPAHFDIDNATSLGLTVAKRLAAQLGSALVYGPSTAASGTVAKLHLRTL